MQPGLGAVRTPAAPYSAFSRCFLAAVMVGGFGVDGIGDSPGVWSSDLGRFLDRILLPALLFSSNSSLSTTSMERLKTHSNFSVCCVVSRGISPLFAASSKPLFNNSSRRQ
jgi:hypothetical protein